jgi:phospholipid/cholesterol/gamma-HCH transport system substrate-binding protein
LKLNREVKTGILAIGAILLFVFGYSYLKGTNIFEKQRTFFVKYSNVEGLAKSAPVTINGLAVGNVQAIDFEDKSGGLIVQFTVEQDFDFSKNSLVKIYSSGIIGGKSLGIFPEYDPKSIAKTGDTLRGEIEQGMLDLVTARLGPLEEKVNTTLAAMDTLMFSLTAVVDKETRSNLSRAIANLADASYSFKGITRKTDALLSDNKEKLDRTFTNLDTTSQNFARLSDSLSQIEIGKMTAQIESITTRLDKIITGIDNGEGSVGKLLKDDKLYDNLEGASHQLEAFLEDMKLNPKRYVHFSLFGKKNKEFVAPQDTIN